MTRKPEGDLRRGWTTGACATAATKAALMKLWGGVFPAEIGITLPRGETPVFTLAHVKSGDGWAEVGITKDAGDDPDVTHGALVIAKVSPSRTGITFKAGDGVGTVTKAGLPIAVGEPSINPVPRQMMESVVLEMASHFGKSANIEITVSIPGGEEIAKKTWNPRLGIKGGLSILGTTGVVRPFSCAAWIASIHRGIDVARADGLERVAACTGATSEQAVQRKLGLPDHAMLDMGDFAGGMLKYLSRHPIPHLTIGGGIGKMLKLSQGALDLHSSRSQVDLEALALQLKKPSITKANTALEAYEIAGPEMAKHIAIGAQDVAQEAVGADVAIDVMVLDRAGTILAETAK